MVDEVSAWRLIPPPSFSGVESAAGVWAQKRKVGTRVRQLQVFSPVSPFFIEIRTLVLSVKWQPCSLVPRIGPCSAAFKAKNGLYLELDVVVLFHLCVCACCRRLEVIQPLLRKLGDVKSIGRFMYESNVSRDQMLRGERGQGNIHFPCSADHEQDWQPYPVDPYSCYM